MKQLGSGRPVDVRPADWLEVSDAVTPRDPRRMSLQIRGCEPIRVPDSAAGPCRLGRNDFARFHTGWRNGHGNLSVPL